MRLAVISDEVSQDPEVLAAFCRSFRLPVDIELRGITFRGHQYKSPFELGRQAAEELKLLFEANEISVIGLASPLLKCDWDDEAGIRQHLDGFHRCLDLCSTFGCKLVRGFAFWGIDDPVIASEARIKAATLYGEYVIPEAEAAGVTIVMENEASTTLSTAKLTASFVGAFDRPNLRIVWDAANEVHAEHGITPFPDAWELVKPYVAHVHVKDARVKPDGKVVSCELGKGVIDWPGQIRALTDLGHPDTVSLETHWRIGEKQLPKEVTDQPGGADFTTAASEASSRICMDYLIDVIVDAPNARKG
jgi:sugar phosphate isomerase/epimerase